MTGFIPCSLCRLDAPRDAGFVEGAAGGQGDRILLSSTVPECAAVEHGFR